MAPANQIHDFNPGIFPFPSGLFWTISFASSSVASQFASGKASFSVQNLAVRDFHSIMNALANGPNDPATVSFDVEWNGVLDRGHFSDPDHSFQLDFVDTSAAISWSGTNQSTGATFTSQMNGPAKFARLAIERNGRFFNSGA